MIIELVKERLQANYLVSGINQVSSGKFSNPVGSDTSIQETKFSVGVKQVQNLKMLDGEVMAEEPMDSSSMPKTLIENQKRLVPLKNLSVRKKNGKVNIK